MLFAGKLMLDLVHPWPHVDPKELERALPWLEKVETFLRDNVDGDRIDRESKVPPQVLDGLAKLGCFGITIPQLELHPTHVASPETTPIGHPRDSVDLISR